MKIIFFSFTVRFSPPNQEQGFASFWFPRWIKGLLPALRKSLAFSHVNFSECFVEKKTCSETTQNSTRSSFALTRPIFNVLQNICNSNHPFFPYHHHHHSKHHSVHLHNYLCLILEQYLESLCLPRHKLRCAFSCLENSPFSDPARLCLALWAVSVVLSESSSTSQSRF